MQRKGRKWRVTPNFHFRAKFDPAVVASPTLTTMVDITGRLIYFGAAKLLLGIEVVAAFQAI